MPNRARWAFDCYEYGMKILVVFFVLFLCVCYGTRWLMASSISRRRRR